MSAAFVKKSIASAFMCPAILLAFSQSSAASQLATTASVYMYSDPGNYIGGGLGSQHVDWVHGVDGIFAASANYGNPRNGVDIIYNDGSFWNFQFSAPSYDPSTNTNDGQPLKNGLYTRAQRYPFNSPTRPGLSIWGNGRGDNQDSGWFDILNIIYNSDGSLASLAVDFKQYDTPDSTGPGLYGSLRFNSNIPINPVPLPGTTTLLLSGAFVTWLLLDRKRLGTEVEPSADVASV